MKLYFVYKMGQANASIFIPIEVTGFEPATPWSQTKCSTKLSHTSIVLVVGIEPTWI